MHQNRQVSDTRSVSVWQFRRRCHGATSRTTNSDWYCAIRSLLRAVRCMKSRWTIGYRDTDLCLDTHLSSDVALLVHNCICFGWGCHQTIFWNSLHSTFRYQARWDSLRSQQGEKRSIEIINIVSQDKTPAMIQRVLLFYIADWTKIYRSITLDLLSQSHCLPREAQEALLPNTFTSYESANNPWPTRNTLSPTQLTIWFSPGQSLLWHLQNSLCPTVIYLWCTSKQYFLRQHQAPRKDHFRGVSAYWTRFCFVGFSKGPDFVYELWVAL